MIGKNILIYFSIFIVSEATMNICIPLDSSKVTVSNPHEVFKDITKDVKSRFSAITKQKPDLELKHVNVDITHPAINAYGDLNDVTISNILDFKICFLENTFVNSSFYEFDVFNMTFSRIRVEGQYNLTGDLGDIFSIYGAGPFWIEVLNVSVAMVNFTLNVTEEICMPVDIEFQMGAMRNHLYNFMIDDETENLFNRAITSIVPEAMKIIWREWEVIFGKPLEKLINDILHRHNTASVFNLLLNDKQVKNGIFCYSSTES